MRAFGVGTGGKTRRELTFGGWHGWEGRGQFITGEILPSSLRDLRRNELLQQLGAENPVASSQLLSASQGSRWFLRAGDVPPCRRGHGGCSGSAAPPAAGGQRAGGRRPRGPSRGGARRWSGLARLPGPARLLPHGSARSRRTPSLMIAKRHPFIPAESSVAWSLVATAEGKAPRTFPLLPARQRHRDCPTNVPSGAQNADGQHPPEDPNCGS